MPPMNSARRRALQAVLSALAGGGLTAAGLGGLMPGAALASETPASTTPEGTSTVTTPAPTTTEAKPPPAPTTTTTTTPTTTGTTPQVTEPPAAAPPVIVVQRRQRTSGGAPRRSGSKTSPANSQGANKNPKATGPNGVALSPQVIAAQAAALANAQASVQALGFYRIPLFLLPIYKAAAVQYGVPWQILAAINEVETNYGTDLSVSSAGAVGWMQFMPATWLQYGVDALEAGNADPYNPVDAIFAAARYLRAAGAAHDLSGAILAYNHSAEYVSSVLLRAKLISSYPKAVVATLTGLVDGRLPVTGSQVAWGALPQTLPTPTSATAGAAQVHPAGSGASAPAPAAAAAARLEAPRPLALVDVRGSATAKVVAVEGGRVVRMGASRGLGRYLVLRDVSGDVFTYAGLGALARDYAPGGSAAHTSAVLASATSRDPAPSGSATAGVQVPQTLKVAPAHPSPSKARHATLPTAAAEAPSGAAGGKVRLYAHPGNLDAHAAAAAASSRRAALAKAARLQPLRAGSVVPAGTVLGSVNVSQGSQSGHIRFAVQPSGDINTVDPGPLLANWAQLQTALHPQGAHAGDPLLGATASDALLLSGKELQRAVLSDPGITINGCARADVASGSVDRRVLALLSFLSRSGLHPTVGSLRCGQPAVTSTGDPSAAYRGDALEITAVNGVPIAGHQGAGSVTDLLIRTLLTLPQEYVPARILSLMRYPGTTATHASSAYWNRVHIEFDQPVKPLTTAAQASHAGKAARAAAITIGGASSLSSTQWDRLFSRIGSLTAPAISAKPSSAAIPDPKKKG